MFLFLVEEPVARFRLGHRCEHLFHFEEEHLVIWLGECSQCQLDLFLWCKHNFNSNHHQNSQLLDSVDRLFSVESCCRSPLHYHTLPHIMSLCHCCLTTLPMDNRYQGDPRHSSLPSQMTHDSCSCRYRTTNQNREPMGIRVLDTLGPSAGVQSRKCSSLLRTFKEWMS